MERLEEEYLNNQIASQDVDALHRQISGESDDTVSQRMRERWDKGDLQSMEPEPWLREEMWGHVNAKTKIDEEGSRWKLIRRWWLLAASVLLPIFMLMTGYLFWKQATIPTHDIVVETGYGEKASVTLPDGSKVMLNQKSLLTYNLNEFSKYKRIIKFDGEGYFEIAKDKSHPFDIQGDRNMVRVFGTKFNLFSRSAEAEVILSMDEGCLQLTATESLRQVNVYRLQRAILNKVTGTISIENIDEQIDDASAWRRNELVFHHTPLKKVLQRLEQTYGVDFVLQKGINEYDLYTGTMSTNDMQINLKILENLYHLKATAQGNRIYLKIE